MVRQGELPNPRNNSSAQRVPGTDGQPFCCVYSYAANDEIVGAACVELDDVLDVAACTTLVDNPLNPDAPPRVFGALAECCRDCELLARKLIIARCGNRHYLVGGGGVLDSSPAESPEDCCCGDVPRCVQVPGCNQVDCYPEPPSSGDPCDGRCMSMEYDAAGNEIVEDRGLLCATKVQCCAEDNSSCENRCYDSTVVAPVPGENPVTPPFTIVGPTNQWTAMACTSDECGVCCEYIYNLDKDSPTYGQSIMRIGNTTMSKEDCEASFFDPPIPAIDAAVLGPVGEWVANTDDVNVCNPLCCLDQQFGDAREANCHYTSQLFCDPCVGRCVDLAAENDPGMCPRAFCATKQECCGAGGEKCIDGQCADEALYRWEPMVCVSAADDLCGVCCKHVYNASETEIISLECDPAANTKELCERFVDGQSGLIIYGTWVAFGACSDCAPGNQCCAPACANDVACRDIGDAECNECAGRCAELDENGLDTGTATCKEKWDCCGQFNELCDPDCGVPARYKWTPLDCTSINCGICCLPDDVVAPDPMSRAACLDAGGVWHEHAKDVSVCAPYKCCEVITTVADRTKVVCAPAAEECRQCEGICVEFSDNGCNNEYCATYIECCGPGGINCAPNPNATHSFAGTHPCGAYSCPGCCCANVYPPFGFVNNLGTATAAPAVDCEQCFVNSYTYQCSYVVADCADCPPCPSGVAGCVSDCVTANGVTTCVLSGSVSSIDASPCAGIAGATYAISSVTGWCSVWQPACDVNAVAAACTERNNVEILRAIFSGTAPDGSAIYEEAYLSKSGSRWVSDSYASTSTAGYNPKVSEKTGRIETFEWHNGEWRPASQKLGNALLAEQNFAGLGASSINAVSGDGTVLVAQLPRRYDGSGSTQQMPTTYIYDLVNNYWVLRHIFPHPGQAGVNPTQFFLNEDGTVLSLMYPNSGGCGGGLLGACVFVYEWDGSAWTQRGSTINYGDTTFVPAVQHAMSADGNTIVVRVQVNDRPERFPDEVVIYKWNGSDWAISGRVYGTILRGATVSADGNTVAIFADTDWGVPFDYSDDCRGCGKITVFSFTGGAWSQAGGAIIVRPQPTPTDDRTAFRESSSSRSQSVALSADGTVLAVAAEVPAGYDRTAPELRVWELVSGQWERRGGNVAIPYSSPNSRVQLSMTNDGGTVVVGYDDSLVEQDKENAAVPIAGAWIFDWNGSGWTQRGQPIVADRGMITEGLALRRNSGGFSRDGVFINTAGNRVTIISGGLWTQQYVVDIRPDCTQWRLGAWYVDALVSLTGAVRGWATVFAGEDTPPGNIDARAWPGYLPGKTGTPAVVAAGLQRQSDYKQIGGCDPDYVGQIAAIWYENSENFGYPPGSVVEVPFMVDAEIQFLPKMTDLASVEENPFP